MDGKLGRRRGQLNALGGLIFLQDSVSKQQFLVDTGAAVSVFPHRSSAATSGPLLAGADGKPISAWGKVTKKLNFGLHTFIVSFILAASGPPPFGHYTTFTIQGSELPGVLFAPVFVGREWVLLFPHWLETVCSVKK